MQEAAMNSAGVTVSDSPTPGNLFDEFEEAFQNCLAPLTKEDPLNGINQEELNVNAETNGQRFLELAHRMEAFFLQKRFLLSVQKPESLILEDLILDQNIWILGQNRMMYRMDEGDNPRIIRLANQENHEMRVEIQRKDELIKKETEKLTEWQNTLMNLIARVGSVPSYGTRSPNIASQPSGPLPLNHSTMMTGGGVQPVSNQCSLQQINSSGNIGMVGGMSHGPSNIPHNINSGGSSMSHQPMMGQQVNSGSSNISGGTQGGYQPMNSLGSPGNPMHSGNIGGGPNQMGSMGGTLGSINMGNMTSSMGSGMSISRSQGPISSSGGMFHGNAGGGGPNSMAGMSQSQGGLQGPLAYLEKTTTNIGMPEPRR